VGGSVVDISAMYVSFSQFYVFLHFEYNLFAKTCTLAYHSRQLPTISEVLLLIATQWEPIRSANIWTETTESVELKSR
jgi:hypothetical protein